MKYDRVRDFLSKGWKIRIEIRGRRARFYLWKDGREIPLLKQTYCTMFRGGWLLVDEIHDNIIQLKMVPY